MTFDNTRSMTAAQISFDETEILSLAELDAAAGGDPKGYHECTIGSVGGGGPGLYPLYVQCRLN